jgi:hypothetical protein
LDRLLAVPFGTGDDRGRDHAEGMALSPTAGPARELMICYDSPSKARLDGDDGVRVDVFDIQL